MNDYDEGRILFELFREEPPRKGLVRRWVDDGQGGGWIEWVEPGQEGAQ